MHQNLYRAINAACCHISVLLDNELISEGSGFAFLNTGQVITAAHVVTGRTPIIESDFRDPGQRIFCKFPGRAQHEYYVNTCGLDIRVPGFSKPLQVDIATLQPKQAASDLPFLVVNTNPPQLGEIVFAAGYSDELSAPFQLDELIAGGTDALNEVTQSGYTGYLTDLGGPIIKRGVIGHLVRGQANLGNKEVHIELFYIDNSIHSGASGGPICNAHGEAVGVITRRAVTSASQEAAPNIVVPSGCTIGIGLQPLRVWADT
ncbi:S1 family peptidase [Frateuria sp.]|uniref:S1 family peptidase n=1 Tax=Frateuria sp. TaxID=2211372 RepID=UPI0039C8A04D